MAQRMLAVIAAVAMVLVAIVVRSSLDDDGGTDGGDGGGGGGGGSLVLVCARDLADACEALDGVTVVEQDAATTAQQVTSGSGLPEGADGWVTTSAWTEVVDARSPGRLDGQEMLAHSPVVVAVDPRRTSFIKTICRDDGLWGCLGNRAGLDLGELGGNPQWGSLKVGLPSADSATGLSVLASVASGFFGRTDFASNDFDDSRFESWLSALARPSGTGEQAPVRTLVTTRGKYTAVGDVAAAVGDLDADVLPATPTVDATVVLVDLRGGDRLPGAAPIRTALVDEGWDVASGDTPAATLKPGVLAALHTLWTEVTR